MTIIYFEINKHDETFYLRQPILGCEKGKKLRIVEYFFKNKNKTTMLKSNGFIRTGNSSESVSIPAGEYDFNKIFKLLNAVSYITINKTTKTFTSTKAIILNEAIAKLLGFDTSGQSVKYTGEEITLPENIDCLYVHCNLVDEEEVMLGRETGYYPILAFIPMLSPNVYSTSNSSISVQARKCGFLNHIRFQIKDVNCLPIEGGIYPLHLALEII